MISPQVKYQLLESFQHSRLYRSIRLQLLWQRYLILLILHSSISILGIHFVPSIRLNSGGIKMKQGLPLCLKIFQSRGEVFLIDAVIKVRRGIHAGQVELERGGSGKFSRGSDVGNQSWIFIGRTDAEAETPTLATWCKELTHLKRSWCRERLKAGGEENNRGWDGCMASLTQWTWVWVNSGSWWWTGRPGVLQSMGSQRVRHNWATELNWC